MEGYFISAMKKILIFIILIFVSVLCWSQQPGFKKLYRGDITGASFVDILWDGEKLITAGQFLTDTAPNNALNGLLYMEMDTNGNTLFTDIYFHPNEAVTPDINNSIAKSTDGKVYSMSQILYDTSVLLTIYQNSVRLNSKVIPVYGLNCWLYHYIELDSNILLTGMVQNHQYRTEGILLKSDKTGNEIWQKNYGHSGIDCGISEPFILDVNTIIIPGLKRYWPTSGPIINKWTKSWVIAVDSIGNIKWEWESEKNVESGIATRIQHLPNGNWLYATTEFTPMPGQIDDFGTRPKLICRDSSFNLVWEKYLSDFDSKTNYIVDITPTSDGNFLVVGRWNWYTTTTIHKFSPDGNSIWSYHDDCEPFLNCDNLLGGVVEIPSGSIFAAGYTENYATNFASGLLIKLDKNGCMDTLCSGMTGTHETNLASKIKVYPNPTYDIINISNPIGTQIDLFDITGRKVSNTPVTGDNQIIDIRTFPRGVYLLKMQEKTLHVTYKIIKQ